MTIQAINPSVSNVSFEAKTRNKKEGNENFQKSPEFIEKKKVPAIVLATALSAAVLGGGAVYSHNRAALRSLGRRAEEAISENSSLREATERIQQRVNTLVTENETLQKANKALQDSIDNTTKKFNEIFEGDLAPKDLRQKILDTLKEKIEKGDYGYDIQKPPTVSKNADADLRNAVPLPEHVSTRNRAGMRGLDIPAIAQDGRFNFELPLGEAKITRAESIDFVPTKEKTTVSENYSNSVQWNNDKISRDLLQNFYDGHGQTLDGVKLAFEPTANGKYKVRIEGKSTYTADKALYIGESSKQDDVHAAGNYGEGLKMVALKLLRDCGADNVRIASDNWKLIYNLETGNIADTKVLSYDLQKSGRKLDGNYLEFETNNKDLLQSLRTTINRFYHSNNKHFECPDFENDLIMIKHLPKGEKGGIYITGQRFEFDGNYDGLDEIVVNIKEKLPADVYDPSRDRTSLHDNHLESFGGWLAGHDDMTMDDKVKLITTLKKYWDAKSYFQNTPMDKFTDRFVNYVNLFKTSSEERLKIKFPEEYVAITNKVSDDIISDFKSKGYKVCKGPFEEVGMPKIEDVLLEKRKHDVVIPNDVQKKKILILKEAIGKLAPAVRIKHFSPSELDTHIYMFDRMAPKERKLYSDSNAEAIIDKGVSKGFWIDKEYLDTSKFHEALETALHELSHKAGGDESAEFSYKLTRVNADVLGYIVRDAQTRYELQALSDLWKSLE